MTSLVGVLGYRFCPRVMKLYKQSRRARVSLPHRLPIILITSSSDKQAHVAAARVVRGLRQRLIVQLFSQSRRKRLESFRGVESESSGSLLGILVTPPPPPPRRRSACSSFPLLFLPTPPCNVWPSLSGPWNKARAISPLFAFRAEQGSVLLADAMLVTQCFVPPVDGR